MEGFLGRVLMLGGETVQLSLLRFPMLIRRVVSLRESLKGRSDVKVKRRLKKMKRRMKTRNKSSLGVVPGSANSRINNPTFEWGGLSDHLNTSLTGIDSSAYFLKASLHSILY